MIFATYKFKFYIFMVLNKLSDFVCGP